MESFFKNHPALGWERAGTLTLHIRYGQMTLALIAEALICQLRQRLGPPYAQWDVPHFAQLLFGDLEGDVRVEEDTIIVTYYHAPNVERLRPHYEHLPERLAAKGLKPHIPWRYNYQLDFRFK